MPSPNGPLTANHTPAGASGLSYPAAEEYEVALSPPPGRRPFRRGINQLEAANHGRFVGSRSDMTLWAAGQFAYVFRCELRPEDGGGAVALRCPRIPPPADVAARAAAHARFLADHSSPYFVPVGYFPEGIFVANHWRPLYTMVWAEGETLWTVARGLIESGNSAGFIQLAQEWERMAADLKSLGVAHGDLHPDNVVVDPKTFHLRLVDYDTLFVPELAGKQCPAAGSVGYVHPAFMRTAAPLPRPFGPEMDEFSVRVIALSLRALGASPDLWGRWTRDHLLLPPEALAQPNAPGAPTDVWRLLERHTDPVIVQLARSLREECRHDPLTVARPPDLREVVSGIPAPSRSEATRVSPAVTIDRFDREARIPSSLPDFTPPTEVPGHHLFRSVADRDEVASTPVPPSNGSADSLPPHRRFRTAAEREAETK